MSQTTWIVLLAFTAVEFLFLGYMIGRAGRVVAEKQRDALADALEGIVTSGAWSTLRLNAIAAAHGALDLAGRSRVPNE